MFDYLIELLRKVAKGDDDALKKSEMEKVTVGKPLSVNLSARELLPCKVSLLLLNT